jgi:hypothetical protein
MQCWSCGAPYTLFGKLSFRAVCERCDAALHSCQNCTYYKPGLPNDCAVPGTDYIRDRQANNFCEEFRGLSQVIASKAEERTKKFDDLFN